MSYTWRTSWKPSISTCRRARSNDARSCWFGDVEVWVKNASLNASRPRASKSWSRTWTIDACRSADSDLWVECVAYTRTRARSGSGSSLWLAHSARSTPSMDARHFRYSSAYRGDDNVDSSRSAETIAVRCRAQGTAVANAYHASSHRKQMSGLIARTSSITRRGL